MPIVVATLRALLRPEYDLFEAQSTTHSTTPLVVVSGPLAEACGIAGGFGALGPGHRANASIGRAVRLCLLNIGGARPGVSDMALLGHGGKFTMCLTEDVAQSPWPACSVDAGFDPFDSVVTVIGVEAPHSVVFVDDADDPDSPAAPAAAGGAGDRQPGLEQRVLPDRLGGRRPQPRPRRRARAGRAEARRRAIRAAPPGHQPARRAAPPEPGVRRSRRRRRRAGDVAVARPRPACSSPAAAGCTRRCSRRGRPAPTPTRSSTSASTSTRPARSRPAPEGDQARRGRPARPPRRAGRGGRRRAGRARGSARGSARRSRCPAR